MKAFKSLLIIAALSLSFSMQGQILISLLLGDKLNSDGLEFGIEGGFNWANINELDTKRRAALNLGFYFDIRLKNQWSLYTGVLVKSRLGAEGISMNDLERLGIEPTTEPGEYSQVIDYFIVPALLKYNFDNRMYLEAGPQFGLMYNAFVEFNGENDTRETRIREKNTDDINRLDAGFTFGTGYKLKATNGMTIGIKYYQGLANVYKGISGSRNNSIFLKLNIPIGAGEAEKGEKQLDDRK